MIIDFESDNDSYMLTFEDDGKVAYAYLKKEGTVVGDVWLYNRCPTPEEPEWSDKVNIPFANSKEYAGEEGRILREVRTGDVLVAWQADKNGPLAYVYLFDDLCGVIGVGDKPGYARYAARDGPLAKVMVSNSDP
jgi:hypothetical protein